jgi:hypothetical protein
VDEVKSPLDNYIALRNKGLEKEARGWLLQMLPVDDDSRPTLLDEIPEWAPPCGYPVCVEYLPMCVSYSPIMCGFFSLSSFMQFCKLQTWGGPMYVLHPPCM